jgi:hypothetical protein
MQAVENLSLGSFGDIRLDKGGRRFSGASFARAVFACAGSRTVYGLGTCGFGAFWPISV